MKMDRMVEYLENRGFKAEKRYDKLSSVYVFTVSKDGFSVTDGFKYPGTADYSVVDREQRKFLDHMIDYWKRKANAELERRKNMPYITWKVEDYAVQHVDPTSLPCLEVSLSGCVNNYGAYRSRQVEEIMKELEDRLNSERTDFDEYVRRDVEMTKQIARYTANKLTMEIKDVIFNDPATIVFWMDGTKTVVKCQEGDEYDPEKGLAMAISKKALGNQGNYFSTIKKWTEKYEERCVTEHVNKMNEYIKHLPSYTSKRWDDILKRFSDAMNRSRDDD